ncbi:MAG: hypothetical protein ACOH2A_00280 [Sphingobacteriaceae bacterium]
MKSHLRNIVLSYLLLVFFSAGQFVAYAHQHPINCSETTSANKHQSKSQKSFDYKCGVCQLLNHSHMMLFVQNAVMSEIIVRDTPYTLSLPFSGRQIIPSAGRGPPQA